MSRKKRIQNEDATEQVGEEVGQDESEGDSWEEEAVQPEEPKEAVVEAPVIEEAIRVPEPVPPTVIPEVIQPIPVKEVKAVDPDANKTVRLDGSPINLKYVKEQMRGNPNVRIVEISPGEYKTLQRMRG